MKKVLLVCCILAGIAGWYYFSPQRQYPEIRELDGRTYSFGELTVFFTDIARKKGAVYAFDLLKRAPLPENTDMHLLGHVIGDELYKKEGMRGIGVCTQDFRNACSHSIVVGFFLEYKEAGIPDIAEACRQAPGGSGAYTMCFHGLGHGILAAVDYKLPEAIALCQKIPTVDFRMREAAECTGGAVMEIISGGFHNKKLWQAATRTYLGGPDPVGLCTSSYMPASSRPLCLEYLTPHLVAAAGGTLDTVPHDAVLTKAFGYCRLLADESDRAACFAGFGKEFVVLVHARDTRSFADMPESEIRQVYRLCQLAGGSGENACLTHALDSLYWGGEQGIETPMRFCSLMESAPLKDNCFRHLMGAVRFFAKDDAIVFKACRQLPQGYEKECR